MSYRHHAPPAPLLIGLDPFYEVAADHLARLIEFVVEETVTPKKHPFGPGQRPFDPRLCVKVLMLAYATGVRSSRAIERLCEESLPYRLLTRGDTPSYRTLCFARIQLAAELEAAFIGLFAIADELGMRRVGRLTVDATKMRANASPEAVVRADEYEAVKAELSRILEEAKAVDAQEDGDDGRPNGTRLGAAVDDDPGVREQMRDILRRVRRAEKARRGSSPKTEATGTELGLPAAQTPIEPPEVHESAASASYTPEMLERITAAVAAIERAQQDGLGHLCLTDIDARMMPEGREKQLRECHSFEAAVDGGLLVVGQSTQTNNDNDRLPDIIAAAEVHEPGGILAVTADSGYYGGTIVSDLIAGGIDTCVPDSHTTCDLHRGLPIGTTRRNVLKRTDLASAGFIYDEAADRFTCAEGHLLTFRQERVDKGQIVRAYSTEADCQACRLAQDCLHRPEAKHRTLKVGLAVEVLEAARRRFAEPEHQDRYRHRGEEIESVFGILRGTLGYTRWLLRGAQRIQSEARLFRLGYQLRRIQGALQRRRLCEELG